MESRKLWLAAGTICLVLFLIGLAFTPVFAQQIQKPIVLKAAHNAPRAVGVALGLEAWCKEIEKRTNGRVKFEMYWAASLLKVDQTIKGTAAGIADVCFDVPSYHPSETPFANVGGLGYVTSKIDASAKAETELYKEFPIFRNEFERFNVKVMFFVPFPPNIMGFSSPVKRLEDLKGKKIRATGWLNDVVAKLGATPVGIPVNELYEALSRKVIDGFTSFAVDGIKGFKFDEVCKYYLDFGYGNYTVGDVIFSKNKWDSLPPDIRKIIEEVNGKAIDIYLDVFAEVSPKNVAPLKDSGCSFYTLPEDEANRWKKLVVPALWNDWIEREKKNGPSQEFFNRYLELVKKYEPQSKFVDVFPK